MMTTSDDGGPTRGDAAETSAATTVEFVDRRTCGFGDLDQTGQLKLSSIIRFVMDGYGRAHEEWHDRSRADYFTATGLQPITTYVDLQRGSHQLELDQQLEVRFTSDAGFFPGPADDPPRYGGRDRIQLTDQQGRSVGGWQQHWLWHRLRTGELLHDPPPGREPEHRQQLSGPPRRPRRSQDAEAKADHSAPFERRFHWTLRETDLNQHINVTGYLERAQNALADAHRNGAAGLAGARMWFRRPAQVDDEMVATVDAADPPLVELRRAATDQLCAALAFRAREVPTGS